MTTMEQIRDLVNRAETPDQILEGLEWADKKAEGWDPYYQELVGHWFLMRSFEIERR